MTYSAANGCLKGRTILVTGAGDGIGRQASLTYAEHGATVILLGRTTAKLESVYDEIINQGSPEPAIVPMDLASVQPLEMQEMTDVVLEKYTKLDGVLHNAAILGDRVPVEHYDMNTWLRVMQVNLNAVCIMTRILMPVLRLAPSASVIFTTSSVGTTPRAYWGAYSVSKYALEGYAKLLADEMRNTSDIRFNILNPGGTRTKMRAAAFPTENPMTLKTADELMPLYLYLMNDDSLSEQGQTFTPEWLA
ncbi:MAG: YciK family oxidoreductase [Pseudomonadales bacterium]|nr:YciK family oxidoreductase [Pseudomonadales bacterium]